MKYFFFGLLLIFGVLIVGETIRALWPWFPFLGVCCGASFMIGRWTEGREERDPS